MKFKHFETNMLYLVGENIDKHRAHRLVKQDKLIPIMRGILVESTSNIDEVLLSNSIRISNYLYPKTYLSGVSAETMYPTLDGRLFVSGKRSGRTQLRALEIVQYPSPIKPETEDVTINDNLGRLVVRRSTRIFRFVESFCKDIEAGGMISEELKLELVDQLVTEFGGKDELIQRLWQIGNSNNWQYPAELVTRFLSNSSKISEPVRNRFDIFWHDEQVGRLEHDGSGWIWKQNIEVKPNPVRMGPPGSLPPFIENILPEGWLKNKIHPRNEIEFIAGGIRYLSNIQIKAPAVELGAAITGDYLRGKLVDWSNDGEFTGLYSGPEFRENEIFGQVIMELYKDGLIPRVSGVQMKIPMTLTDEGELLIPKNKPFTHMLKLNTSSEFRLLPKVEYACLQAAKSCGFDVPAHTILNLPNISFSALIIERFDIRQNEKDNRRIILEELNILLGQTSKEKYESSIEKAGKALSLISTNWEEDCISLVLRFLFAWLIGDGDLHLKNLGMLCITSSKASHFTSIRLAPVYDSVSTRFFPNFSRDLMALTVNGKRNKLSTKDFLQAGASIGLNKGLVQKAIEKLCQDFSRHVKEIERTDLELAPLYELWENQLSQFEQWSKLRG